MGLLFDDDFWGSDLYASDIMPGHPVTNESLYAITAGLCPGKMIT